MAFVVRVEDTYKLCKFVSILGGDDFNVSVHSHDQYVDDDGIPRKWSGHIHGHNSIPDCHTWVP